MPKMPPRDEKALKKMKDLFKKGLEDAEKDPDKYMYLKRQRLQKAKPWEDATKNWDAKSKTKKRKKGSLASRVVSRFQG